MPRAGREQETATKIAGENPTSLTVRVKYKVVKVLSADEPLHSAVSTLTPKQFETTPKTGESLGV
jgi:hypothetical protein